MTTDAKKNAHRRLIRRWLLGVFGLSLPCSVLWAQSPGLYDPQPPANAAYVRVLVGGSQAVDVLIDQQAKASKVPAARPSSYMLVSPGAHQLTIRAGGNRVHVPLNVVPSRFFTVLLSEVQADAKPVVTARNATTNCRFTFAKTPTGRHQGPCWQPKPFRKPFCPIPC